MFHDMIPSEDGAYLDSQFYVLHMVGCEWSEVGVTYPVFGPLPEHEAAMLGIACEVAFARMWMSESQYATPATYSALCRRFNHGERSPELLREMQAVTRELNISTNNRKRGSDVPRHVTE